MTIILDNCENLWAEQVTIAAGASAASAIQTGGRALVGILMPAAWTAAQIGFDVSVDGARFVPSKNDTLTQAKAEADIFIPIPQSDTIFAPFLRLKSVDAAGVAVNQVAARTLVLLFRRFLS